MSTGSTWSTLQIYQHNHVSKESKWTVHKPASPLRKLTCQMESHIKTNIVLLQLCYRSSALQQSEKYSKPKFIRIDSTKMKLCLRMSEKNVDTCCQVGRGLGVPCCRVPGAAVDRPTRRSRCWRQEYIAEHTPQPAATNHFTQTWLTLSTAVWSQSKTVNLDIILDVNSVSPCPKVWFISRWLLFIHSKIQQDIIHLFSLLR